VRYYVAAVAWSGLFAGMLLATRAPGPVTDLVVLASADTTLSLAWTGAASGDTTLTHYDVRMAAGTFTASNFPWGGNGASVKSGTCAGNRVPGRSATGGERVTCTVGHLTPSTAYSFELVPYTGTLNLNAVFGPLSNVANGMTAAAAVRPVATVTVLGQLTLLVGQSQRLLVTLRDSVGAALAGTVTWTATGVVTVDGTGLVTAVSAGTGSVTATSANGIRGTCAVTVVLVPVRTLTVSPAVDTLTVGGSVQLVATALDSAGHELLGRPVTWSDTTAVVSVSPTGMVGALAPGTGRVWATSGAISASAILVVLAPVPPPTPTALAPQLLIVPPGLTPGQGARVTFYAVLRDSTGQVTIGEHATWSSSDTTVAKVDSVTQPVGIFFPGPGLARITATFGGLTASASVNVAKVTVATLTAQLAPCVISQTAPTDCGPYPVVNNATHARLGSIVLTIGP